MRLGDMRAVLSERNIQLTKSLGQNFLHDANQLQRIVDAAEVGPEDYILEIGPGLGPLTALLAKRAKRVLAVEMDLRLVKYLQERFKDQANLEIMHADGLDVARDVKRDWADWKLVANLPYSVASPLLVDLAQHAKRPRTLTATLQKEVVLRLCADHDSKAYGLLSLLVQMRYLPIGNFSIPRTCFFPEPDVDSACITMHRREPALVPEEAMGRFETAVRLAFSQRRKKSIKLLRARWPAEVLDAAFQKVGLSTEFRAEHISLAQYVELVAQLP